MREKGERGLTLVELIISLTIMGIIATASIPLLSSTLEIYGSGTDRSRLYHEGLVIMERMTESVRKTTYLLIPNAHNTTRDILAFSGIINDDDDYYFNDTLFPRIDEDNKNEMDDALGAGIDNIDDDGDGHIDEENSGDDDEDGEENEEILDGIDNDLDGNIDEDLGKDANGDNTSGIAGMDDDGNGNVDDQDIEDDDEDGYLNEDPLNPLIYSFDSATSTLREIIPYTGTTVDLSTHVTTFEVKYQSPGLIEITLELTGDDGEKVEFKEHAYARNTYQRTGKRVR